MKIITGIQWGEKPEEIELQDSRTKTKLEKICGNEVICEVKAYTTRTGKGGFPTEQNNKIGDKIRELGHEYDMTTGKPLRCGWLDLVMLKNQITDYDITSIAITGLDTIGQIGYIDSIQACTTYVHEGILTKSVPRDVENCRPLYETFFGGWDMSKCKSWKEIPDRTKRYIEHISRYVGVPVRYIKIGTRTIICY